MRRIIPLVAIALFAVLCTAAVYADVCYNNVQSIPATCSGGTITRDDYNRQGDTCRYIFCSSSDATSSIQVKACDKPSATAPAYFEMYRQSATGTVPKVCIGSTCMQSEGYKKSTNYPICVASTTCTPSTEVCDGKDNDCDGATDEGSVCGSTCTPTTEVCDGKDNNCNGQTDENNVCASNTCYTSVKTMPATCDRGTITQDTVSGTCRTIVCGSGSNSLKTLSCDKTGYFEMYKQAQTGTGAKICIASTCIDGNGYAKSPNFPICTQGTQTSQPDVTPTAVSGPSSATSGSSVTLTVNTKNQGGSASNVLVRFYLSTDQTITTGDAFLGEYTKSSYPANTAAVDNPTFTLPYNLPPGTYYYGVTIDELNSIAESNEQNNKVAGTQVSVSRPANYCYQSVSTLPPYCNGGTITSDSFSNGCRQLTCSKSSGSLTASACDKPSTTPTYFEVTRTSMSGTPPELCIGGSCVSSSVNYARSADYPACQAAGDEPGRTSKLYFRNGVLNGYSLNQNTRVLTVAPGQSISGTLNFDYTSTYGSNAVMVMAHSPNWGDHQSSCVNDGSVNTPSSGSKSVPITATAPTTPGTYHINFQYRGEFTSGQVCSMTNWAAGNDIWNDGNDMSDWSEATVDEAQANGNTLATLYHSNGYRPWYVPAEAIDIIVRSPVTTLNENFDDGQYTSNPAWVEYRAQHGTSTFSVANGEFHVTRTNAGGWGEEAGITLDTNIPITASTTIQFDLKPVYNSLGGCGIACNEYPAIVVAQVENTDGSTTHVYYSYNYNGGQSHTSGNAVYVSKGDAPQNTWLRNEQHVIRNAAPNAKRIVSIKLIGAGHDFESYFDNVKVFDTSADPGATSSLLLQSGTVNGQSISSSNKQITVQPGQAITGSVTLGYTSTWPSNAGIQLIGTPNWGTHSTSFTSYGALATPTASSKTVSLNYNAPTTPGTYYIILAYRAEVTGAQVASMTNWAYGSPVWDDGNDLAGWNDQAALDAMQGRLTENLLTTSGYKQVYVPAAAIKVVVQGTPPAQSGPLTQNLLAYYKLDGNLKDIPGGHNGVVARQPVSYVSGKLNQAAQFSKASDSRGSAVNANLYVDTTMQLSVGFWAKFSGGNGTLWQWPARYEIYRLNDGRVQARSYEAYASSVHTVTSANPIPDNQWHYYTIVIDRTSGSKTAWFYIDGVLQGSMADPNENPHGIMWWGGTSDDPYTAGYMNHEGLNGQIDEVGVWERLLAQADINQLYNGGAGNSYSFGTGAPNYSACYAQMQDIPATCSSGSVTQDVLQSDTCRYITCSSGGSSTTVKVCNKPGKYDPQYFEMYVQSGSSINVCLLSTCAGQSSYAKSPNLPVCS
jgi:hypothetical protein